MFVYICTNLCSLLSKGQFSSTQEPGCESLFSLAVSQQPWQLQMWQCHFQRWPQYAPLTPAVPLYSHLTVPLPAVSTNPHYTPKQCLTPKSSQPNVELTASASPAATDGKRAQSKVWMLWKESKICRYSWNILMRHNTDHTLNVHPHSYCNQSRKTALITNPIAIRVFSQDFPIFFPKDLLLAILETGFWVSWSDPAYQFLS